MRTHVRRRDTEALLDGRLLSGDHPLANVGGFLDTMRADYSFQPPPLPRPALAAILVEGRRPLRSVSAPRPVRPQAVRAWRWPQWNVRLRTLVVALTTTGAVTFGGLATAGALPGPLQRASADLSAQVGIDLPRPVNARPTQHHHTTAPRPATGTSGPAGPAAKSPSDPTGQPTTVTGPTARIVLPGSPAPTPVPSPSVPITTPAGILSLPAVTPPVVLRFP
jgi:hypothetical protein